MNSQLISDNISALIDEVNSFRQESEMALRRREDVDLERFQRFDAHMLAMRKSLEDIRVMANWCALAALIFLVSAAYHWLRG